MSDKLKAIDPSKYNVTESGQVLSEEQYAEQKKVLIERINEKRTLLNDKNKARQLADRDYTKIQNYIEAIRLIAEKMKTAESDCIEQLARDTGNYLYDLAKGDKDD